MKNVQRLLALLLVLMLSLTVFVGCAKDDDDDKDSKKETVAQEVADEEEDKEVDPEEAIEGTWTKECDVSDLLNETLASEQADLATYFDFSDINYVFELTFDNGEFSMNGELADDAVDNLTDQLSDSMLDYLGDGLGLTDDDITAYLEESGYDSIEDFVSETMNAEDLLDELEVSTFVEDGEYKFDDDKIYLGDDESLWIEFEFDSEDEAEFEFNLDADESDEETDAVIEMLSGTYTKD